MIIWRELLGRSCLRLSDLKFMSYWRAETRVKEVKQESIPAELVEKAEIQILNSYVGSSIPTYIVT